MAINVKRVYSITVGFSLTLSFVDPSLLYLRGTHFKCYGRGFAFVAYETTILYT